MITITLKDLLDYVESLDPDTVFFDDGYADSCPVARYAQDVLGYPRAFHVLGRFVGGTRCMVQVTKDVNDYVTGIEETYKIGYTGRTLTAKELLSGG